MMESMIGTLLGGAFRLMPELMSWLDKKDERKHELAMFDKQLESDKLKVEAQQKLVELEGDIKLEQADIEAIVAATKEQGKLTGVKWVDAFSAAIRPLMALQWLIVLWPAVVVAGFVLAVKFGTDPLVAIRQMFGPEEKALATSIASFWLVDRTLRKLPK